MLAAIIGASDLSALVLVVNGANVAYGNFLNAIISFALVACVVYLFIVTPLCYLLVKFAVPPLPGPKSCPHCMSAIPALATRCGYCTQEVNAATPIETSPVT